MIQYLFFRDRNSICSIESKADILYENLVRSYRCGYIGKYLFALNRIDELIKLKNELTDTTDDIETAVILARNLYDTPEDVVRKYYARLVKISRAADLQENRAFGKKGIPSLQEATILCKNRMDELCCTKPRHRVWINDNFIQLVRFQDFPQYLERKNRLPFAIGVDHREPVHQRVMHFFVLDQDKWTEVVSNPYPHHSCEDRKKFALLYPSALPIIGDCRIRFYAIGQLCFLLVNNLDSTHLHDYMFYSDDGRFWSKSDVIFQHIAPVESGWIGMTGGLFFFTKNGIHWPKIQK